ncbi:MAG: iron(III) transport system ATP-binding protein [Saprospiraceae bacterium]|jgi:iron(III) transport system ATP-binding protein
MSSLLEVKGIRCHYDEQQAVDDVSFNLEEGALACLLGPSGCGKTTVLRAIAGFQNLAQGAIYLEGECVSKPGYTLLPEKRQLGMVFQDHALFPHMTVGQNVACGLFSMPKKAMSGLVLSMLERVGLSSKIDRYPHELSGGQQQRVALARALAPRPRLLLMDEPFSNLDVELRERLALEVRDLLKDTGTTCIMVTHDQQDAFTFGQMIGVMGEGLVEQWDSAYNVYHEPSSRFVADFIGQGVFLPGKVLDNERVETELAILNGRVPRGCLPGDNVKVLVRPDDIIHNDESPLTARIVGRNFRGSNYLYTLQLNSGSQLLSMVHSHHDHQLGEQLGIEIELDHLVVFPESHSKNGETG